MGVWAKAFQVFIIGFGGVFICLVFLQVSISIFSKLAQAVDRKFSKEPAGQVKA